MSNLREIMEYHVNDTQDVKEGVKRGTSEVLEFMRDPKFKPESMSIRDIFEQTTLREHPDVDVNQNTQLAEAIATSAFPKLTGALIHSMMIPYYEQEMFGVEQLVTESTTTRADFETLAGLTAIPQIERVYQGMVYPSAHFGEKNVKIEIAKFGHIINLTKEIILSDQTGEVARFAAGAGEAMGLHRHRYIVETIIDSPRKALGEATSTAFVYEGSATTVYADTHSTVDGQTNDNSIGSSAITANASWQGAWAAIGAMTDEEGNPIGITPKVILCHRTYEPVASQFVGDVGQPDVANNGSNFFRKLGLKVYTSPYTTSNSGLVTDWYFGDPKRQTAWLWYWKPNVQTQTTSSDAAFEQDIVARFKPNYSAGCGLLDYRRVLKLTA